MPSREKKVNVPSKAPSKRVTLSYDVGVFLVSPGRPFRPAVHTMSALEKLVGPLLTLSPHAFSYTFVPSSSIRSRNTM